MKQSLRAVGLAGTLILALAAWALAASPVPSPLFRAGMYTPQAITSTPQAQSTPVIATPDGQGTSFWGGMWGGMIGRMARNMMGGGPMGWGRMGGFHAAQETMMVGISPTYDDIAMRLGMTTQDLYNYMASGKSLAQIAAEKGITEQQLIDGIMASRRAAYDQAVREGYMTQAQAEAMLEDMTNNLKMMVNGQGVGSRGWGVGPHGWGMMR